MEIRPSGQLETDKRRMATVSVMVDEPASRVLWFVDADWPLIGGAFTVYDVGRALAEEAQGLLTESGPVDQDQIADLQWQLHEAFPRQKQAPPAQ